MTVGANIFISNISKETNCGHLVISQDEGATAYIEAIEISPVLCNEGLGKAMLKYLEFELRDIGIKTIKLNIFAHNKIAVSL